MAKHSLNKQILSLTLPNIITNITIPLLGMVDTAIVGHIPFDGKIIDYIGAVSIGSMIFDMIYWNFGFLRAGTTGFTAQAFGKNDIKEQISILLRGSLIAIIVALLLIVLQQPLARVSSLVINDANNVMDYALKYFFIRIWAAPAVLLMFVLKGWFIGMQDSKAPMYTAIMINVINILFDIYFVIYLNQKIEGVAWATVIAQYSGLALIGTIFFLKYYKRYKIDFKQALNIEKLKLFFKVNSDIYLRSLCVIIVTVFFTVISSYMPYPMLAVNSLIMHLFTLFSYFMDGFAYACEALCGKYYGAQDKENLKRVVVKVIKWGVYLSVFTMIVYGLFSKQILSLLTNHNDIIQACNDFKIWIILIPITGFLAFLYDGILIGLTKSTLMRNVIFFSTVAFFLCFFCLGQTNNALWFSFVIYLLGRGIFMMIGSWKTIFK